MPIHRAARPMLALATAAVAAAYAPGSEARVTRFVVETRAPYAGGAEFGAAGAFERLTGTATMEVDPGDRHNAVIVNLDKAPRNARGMVEFSAPFWIIKPADMAKGNSKLWYAINNRGNSELLPRADRAAVPSLVAKRLELGFALADAGWHGDGIKPDPNRLFPDFPVARNPDGSSIVGPVRLEMLPTADAFSRPFVVGWKPYETSTMDTSSATLTVRDRQGAPVSTIPSDRWAFGACPTGQASLTPTSTDVCLFDGFKANKMYEFIYQAKDPIVMGLAHAVTRDIGSFLRYQTQDDEGNPNPLAAGPAETGIRRAYSSGVSSTGMYERENLYLGFNADESGRRVFDGVTIYTAGAHRLFANVQFAHPTFYARQDANTDYTSNAVPPFTYAVTLDPVSGTVDGLLKRPATDPKVMQIDGGIELWHWKASLNVADGWGRPVRQHQDTRLYYLNGSTHVGTGQGMLVDGLNAGTSAACVYGTQRGSAVNHTFRALVVAMDDWADRGIAPPRSNYPRVEDGTLVRLEHFQATFPRIPGVGPAPLQGEIDVLDFGPRFGPQGGYQDIQPPLRGEHYTVFQPRADADGNDIAGVRNMETRVPLGTNLGWNVRVEPRAPDLCGLSGAYVPFAATRAERQATGDPRRSLKERYRSQQGLIDAVDRATSQLVRERFMLQEDAELYRARARAISVIP